MRGFESELFKRIRQINQSLDGSSKHWSFTMTNSESKSGTTFQEFRIPEKVPDPALIFKSYL